MPDKPKGIFKRLDQFNRPHRAPIIQPVQSEPDEEIKPSLMQVQPVANKVSATQTPETRASIQPLLSEERVTSLVETDVENKAEHPQPDQERVTLKNPFPVSRQDVDKPHTATKYLSTPHSTQHKKQILIAPTSPSTTVADSAPLEEFARRWKEEFRVHSGEIKVLRALYRLTHGMGREDCVTTQDKLAEASDLQRRQCINNVNSLEKIGFIERVEVYNEKGQRGIRLKLKLLPKPPAI